MSDLSVEILKQIRDELKLTRSELATRIDATNSRLDALERRQTEMEVRLATELISVSATITDLKNVLLEDRKLRQQVSDHEKRLLKLEKPRRAG